jgi:hypothetical protein
MGLSAYLLNEMQTVKIEGQTSSGVEVKFHTFLTSKISGAIGLLQAPIALLSRKYSVLFIFY